MRIYVFILVLFSCFHSLHAQEVYTEPNNKLLETIQSTEGLIALWKFNEPPGKSRKASGTCKYKLKEGSGPVETVNEGPLSGYSIKLDGTNYLSLSNDRTGKLNLFGNGQEVTVLAFIKWSGKQTGFVGGMWNEYQDGGKRQYGLFVSLPYYNGGDQVCGHISKTGTATPPFPYSIDYSASKQKVAKNEWCCIAFTYDGEYIKSYYNGRFLPREPELIKHTKGFDGYPDGLVQSKNPYYYPDGMGNNGSDFTVGAVLLKRGMGNSFVGQIGGLAVFDKALSAGELESIHKIAFE